jgi:hypothetical protein
MVKTLVTSLTLASLLLISAAFGQDQATAPTYRDGDSWQFTVTNTGSTSSSTRSLLGDYRLFFKGDEIRVAQVPQEKSEFRQNFAALRRMLAIADNQKHLQFPLSVKSNWSAEYQSETNSGVDRTVHADMSVTGYAEVTTSAGKFLAYKIERYETFRSGGRGKNSSSNTRHSQQVYFYSPETRSIVKLHREESGGETHDFELTKFTPAK